MKFDIGIPESIWFVIYWLFIYIIDTKVERMLNTCPLDNLNLSLITLISSLLSEVD